MSLWWSHTFLWNKQSIKCPLDRSQALHPDLLLEYPASSIEGTWGRMTQRHNQYFIYIPSEAQNEGTFTRLCNHLKGGKSEVSETHSLSNYCFSQKGPHEDWILRVSHNVQSSGHGLKAHSFHKAHTCYSSLCVCAYAHTHAFVHSWVFHRDRNRGKDRLLQEGCTAPRGDRIHSENSELTPSLSPVMWGSRPPSPHF